MSAAVLREAASLMRERAEAATTGPWEARHGGYSWIALYADEDTIPEGESLPSFEPGGSATNHDAIHVASWHPAVALAVADWLDSEAEQVDLAYADGYDIGPHFPGLIVARAYLGTHP